MGRNGSAVPPNFNIISWALAVSAVTHHRQAGENKNDTSSLTRRNVVPLDMISSWYGKLSTLMLPISQPCNGGTRFSLLSISQQDRFRWTLMGPFTEGLTPVITPTRFRGTGSLKISKISYYFPLHGLEYSVLIPFMSQEPCSLWRFVCYTFFSSLSTLFCNFFHIRPLSA